MATGTIVWFGGKRKDGQFNDFGYISVDGEEEDIKVYRKNISIELQELFEQNREKGKGYHVEFDIQNYKIKENLVKKKAIDLKLIIKRGIVISLREVISEDDISYRIKQIDRCEREDIVEFLLKDNEAFIVRQLNCSELSKETIRKFYDGVNYHVVKLFISQYLLTLEKEDAVEYILSKISFFATDKIKIIELLALISTNFNNLFLISSELRQLLRELDIAKYASFLEDNLWSTEFDIQDILWSELVDCIYAADKSSVIFTLLRVYLSNINKQDAIEFILYKINILDENSVKFLDKSLEYNQAAFLESQSLHPYLRVYNFAQYIDVIQQILDSDNQSLCQSVIKDLISFLNSCSDDQKSLIWRSVSYLENNLEYHGYLWDISPSSYKQTVLKEKYSVFFALVNEFKNSEYTGVNDISMSYKELYNFDDNDKKLAQLWGNNNNNDFEKARMLSARGAEKLVKRFYKNIGNNVEDIAVHQISGESEIWRKADIRINLENSQRLIDVKNARQSVNSSVYSEFCIPKFKENRNQEVVIAAVVSPYLQLQYMNGEGAGFRVSNPKYLGELTYSQLQNLTQSFSDSVVRLDMTKGFDTKSYLAPWLFDYNIDFYQEQINIAKKLQSLEDNEIPSYDDLKILDGGSVYDYIPVYIFANKSIPKTWQQTLPEWEMNFIKLLYRQNDDDLKLPHLYMSILKHFLLMLSSDNNNYSPSKIIILLGDKNYPLKINDPLGIIKDFCETLEVVWKNRQQANLIGFRIFKFDGKGLLSGKRSETDSRLTTILAYCGGWTEKQGKCGYLPLVIGRETNCPTCGKLICPKDDCGYCSLNCVAYQQRREQRQKTAKKRLNHSEFYFTNNY